MENISNLYDKFAILTDLRKMVHLAKIHSYKSASTVWQDVSKAILDLCNEYMTSNPLQAQKAWSAAENAVKSTGGIMDSAFADLIETNLIPEVTMLLSDLFLSDDYLGPYTVTASASGFMTLQNEQGVFLHGMVDPLMDGFLLAKDLLSDTSTEFHVFAPFLGYLPYALYMLSEESIDIYVYEYDKYIMEADRQYGMLSRIPDSRLHVLFNEDKKALFQSFLENISKLKETDCVNYYIPQMIAPDMQEACGASVIDFIANSETARITERSSTRNFCLNIKNAPNFLKKEELASEWIVVAAGPSLDQCAEYIRENVGRKKIICVSTVYKKLLSAGISPDYVCVLDPGKRTFGHMNGVDCFDSTLIVGAEATWQYADVWAGPKYIFPCGITPFAQNYFSLHEITSIPVSGTVTNLAMEIALYLGAKTVHLIGLDLSFPEGKSHASGTMDLHKENTKDPNAQFYVEVDSSDGGKVVTTYQFLAYAKAAQSVIDAHPEVTFINHSKIGIKFNNCKLYE